MRGQLGKSREMKVGGVATYIQIPHSECKERRRGSSAPLT